MEKVAGTRVSVKERNPQYLNILQVSASVTITLFLWPKQVTWPTSKSGWEVTVQGLDSEA